jgi:hypothetical protein
MSTKLLGGPKEDEKHVLIINFNVLTYKRIFAQKRQIKIIIEAKKSFILMSLL